MIKKGIRGGICQAMQEQGMQVCKYAGMQVYGYEKANNKYMKDYYPSTELSYLMNWHENNLYG